jgi:hypothetical protein
MLILGMGNDRIATLKDTFDIMGNEYLNGLLNQAPYSDECVDLVTRYVRHTKDVSGEKIQFLKRVTKAATVVLDGQKDVFSREEIDKIYDFNIVGAERCDPKKWDHEPRWLLPMRSHFYSHAAALAKRQYYDSGVKEEKIKYADRWLQGEKNSSLVSAHVNTPEERRHYFFTSIGAGLAGRALFELDNTFLHAQEWYEGFHNADTSNYLLMGEMKNIDEVRDVLKNKVDALVEITEKLTNPAEKLFWLEKLAKTEHALAMEAKERVDMEVGERKLKTSQRVICLLTSEADDYRTLFNTAKELVNKRRAVRYMKERVRVQEECLEFFEAHGATESQIADFHRFTGNSCKVVAVVTNDKKWSDKEYGHYQIALEYYNENPPTDWKVKESVEGVRRSVKHVEEFYYRNGLSLPENAS